MFMLYCKTLLLFLRWDTGKVWARLGGMVRFEDGFRGSDKVKSEITDMITKMYYKINYMQVLLNISTM